MSNVKNIGIWKKNCTPVEKLKEVLQYAESGEGKVKHVLIIYIGESEISEYESSKDLDLANALFMLEQTKFDLFLK